MSGFPDLRGVQNLVWRLITAPEGVARGCESLHREGVLARPDPDFLVRGGGALPATERLDVYADMYFYRLHDSLAEDFPCLAAWLGPARFHNLVTDYLLAHPSRHPSLRELGRSLPGFLEGHPLPAAFRRAAALARLEWARLDVFDDADAAALSRETLLAEGATDPERFILGLVPAVRLLRLDAGVLPLWRALEDGQTPASDAPEAGAVPGVCVWRRDFAIFHRSLEADEERCLVALARGPVALARLGELVAEAGSAGDPEAASRRFAALLERWTADGLLRPVDPPGTAPAAQGPDRP